jgi:uncharacterized protein YqjF (DUF2071 family)
MREWPPPQRTWIMAQTWRDLLFAHWPVPADELARILPPQLELDLWNGEAWIGVVPFRMDCVRPRGMFPLPWLSATPENNVRTYVKAGGKRGVYFFSLHASNLVAVKIAHRFFHLPYFQATMNVRSDGETVHYAAQAGDAEFRGWYRPSGEIAPAQQGSLEDWLTERYCFYTVDKNGRVIRGDIDHAPWPLQPADASIEVNTMTAASGIRLPDAQPLLHFSSKLDIRMWMPERI